MKKYKSLDCLKFLCAIIIANVFHYAVNFNSYDFFSFNKILYSLSYLGYLLTYLFFVISGFLFYNCYYKTIINKKEKFRNFIKKRYIRLMPLAIITSIFMFLLQWIYHKNFNHFYLWANNDIINLLFQISGIQYWIILVKEGVGSLNNPVWYISSLLFSYTFYYYYSKLTHKYKNKLLFLIPVLLCIPFLGVDIGLPILNNKIILGIIYFGLGTLVGLLLEKYNIKKIGNYTCFSLVIILLLTTFFGKEIIGNKSMFLCLLFPMILIICIRFENLFNKANDKLISFLSEISFGIYLWNIPVHLVINMFVRLFNINISFCTIKFFIIQLVLNIIVAIISNLTIEKYMKNRINHQNQKEFYS